MEIREILARVDGVSRVHPFGANGTIIVYVTKKGAVSKKSIKGLLEGNKKFSLRKIKKA